MRLTGGRGRTSSRDPLPSQLQFDTLYQPRLDLSPSLASVTPSINTEESLDMNSMALKYLDDNMLSRLARTSGGGVDSRRQHKEKDAMAVGGVGSAGLTMHGLPESHLTATTMQFLESNRMVHGPGNDSAEDERNWRENDGQQKKKEPPILDFDKLLR